MYRILSEVFDVLYGSNIGFQGPNDIFDTASSLLKFEQKFANWQHGLPETLPLISMEELTRPPMEHEVTRLRVVLSTRFLNNPPNIRICVYLLNIYGRSVSCKSIEPRLMVHMWLYDFTS